eukprot:CAMPEP_0175814062 /NCGR_PEP_ID=MMETSP0107_2-20121207/5221_1 /TAXON_ID=195067 ORGANISM="Goniomonas pacifica, Strain CCMP1869" /NCGR_SAMPLE_ID=MMETSP0107_2 /ASSEMBLY_ACC=CAM_ASM_000203 /LENGTH=154 /DNA_ID=CAMNT_0017125989 /DNA_START=807 /DNA_END=1272 /DNA_ORIENTATION=-
MTSAAADTSRLSSLSLASRCSPPPCNMAAAPSVGEAGRVRRLVGEEGKQTNLITAAEVLECFSEVNVPLRLLWMMLYKVLKDFESVAPTRLNPMPRDNKELLAIPASFFDILARVASTALVSHHAATSSLAVTGKQKLQEGDQAEPKSALEGCT